MFQKCTTGVLDERSRGPMIDLILSKSRHHNCQRKNYSDTYKNDKEDFIQGLLQ